ncbi:hypothetical protein K0M31_010088 [Melipona bicolor]|uniref:Uncharacterized protein n=1 Tax=Melipona bicolor TaxID=60889 RepID=A0AA40FMW4_9HYME|nr:hypothetical protein K0M31_010088 [Melipona bicolor]
MATQTKIADIDRRDVRNEAVIHVNVANDFHTLNKSRPTFPTKNKPINHPIRSHQDLRQLFINLLSDRVYVNPQGADLGEEGEEELDEEDLMDEETLRQKEDPVKLKELAESPKKYEVIGTISDPERSAPEDVAAIIKDARNQDALLQELMKCGIVIYDITEDQSQVEEARWALKCWYHSGEKRLGSILRS